MTDSRFRTGRRAFLRAVAAGALAGLAASKVDRAWAESDTETPAAIQVLTADERHDLDTLVTGRLSGLALRRDDTGALGLGGSGELVGPPIAVEFPATHVGLHWLATQPSAGLTFELRTSRDGVAWSDWQPVRIEAHAGEARGGETYGALITADRARWVHYRARFDGAAALRQVTATALNAVDGPRIERAVRWFDPEPKVPFPDLVTREQWGADERLRFEGEPEVWPRAYVPTKHVFVHHTATANGYADAAAEVRAIYTYHAKTLGWGDIGYNLLVGADGRVYEGRYGRDHIPYGWRSTREVAGLDVVAGHVLRYNYGSAGIALIGHFGEMDVPAPMSDRLVEQTTRLCRARGLDPTAAQDFLKSDDTWHRDLARVPGHRDAFPTECPGDYAYARLPEWRERVAASLARSPGPRAVITRGPGDTAPGAATLAWAAPDSPKPAAYYYYLEGWRRVPNSEAVTYLSGLTADGQPVWTTAGPTTVQRFTGLRPGHYTLHVKAADPEGTAGLLEAQTTFQVQAEG